MKFQDTKTTTGFVRDEGTEVGRYSERYLLNQLHELYEIKKVIDRDIRIAEQKLKIKQQGREIRYEKYDLSETF